jgi:hypothetical protein
VSLIRAFRPRRFHFILDAGQALWQLDRLLPDETRNSESLTDRTEAPVRRNGPRFGSCLHYLEECDLMSCFHSDFCV